MAPPSDPFIDCVTAAWRRLEQREGRRISLRELARRAEVPQNTLSYNMNPKRAGGKRQISPQLVAKLCKVLPMNPDDLMRSAQASSGYQVTEQPDSFPELAGMVVRYLDDDLSAEERIAATARLGEIVAEQMRKIAEGPGGV